MMQAAGCWTTENVCPAMVKVPVRCVAVVLASAWKSTFAVPPLPVPGVIVSHGALEIAIHGQLSAATTPAAESTADEGIPAEEERSE